MSATETKTQSNQAAPSGGQTVANKEASVSKVMDDVKSLGKAMKSTAVDAKEALVDSAKDIAADSKTLASQQYDHARQRVREGADQVGTAARNSLNTTRDKIVAEPIKAVAIAVGVGFFLGRFVFGRH